MSRAFKATCLISIFVGLASACGPGAVPADVSVASRSEALIAAPPGAKYWPMPATTDAEGRVSVTWDGTVAELLAADALASCWSGIPESVRKPTDTSYASSFMRGNGFGDPVISELVTKMDRAVCPENRIQSTGWFTRPAHEVFEGWINARKDPTCSIDVVSGEGRVLDLVEQREALSQTAGSLSASIPLSSRREAQAELAYADLYLCMTQRLVEHTQSSFVFDASAEDVLRLYDLARNRALLTVFQYSLIAKVFAMPSTALNGLTLSGYGTVATLKRWANAQTQAQRQAAGRDLAMAVELLSALTEKQVNLLRRDASRQAKGGGGEAQSNILRTLYGDATPEVSRITQDLSEPEVGVLLGLAREADALDLFVDIDDANGQLIVDRERAVSAMLRAAERQLRLQRCPADDTGCAEVPSTLLVDDYDLFTQFGIDRRHALKLVDALTEALLGSEAARQKAAESSSSAPSGTGKLIKVAGALNATCGLFDTGTVACWGTGLSVPSDGGLECSGSDCTSPSRWVTKAGGGLLTDVVELAGSTNSLMCALTKAGEVFCWGSWQKRGGGSNISGIAAATPVLGLPSPLVEPVAQLTAGPVSGCVRTTADRVFCWGSGTSGLLADGTRGGTCSTNAECGPRGGCISGSCQQSAAYTAVPTLLADVRRMDLSLEHGCALTADGSLQCWGRDRYGVIGGVAPSGVLCGSDPCFPTPVSVPLPAAVGKPVSVAVNNYSTCVLSAVGEVYCWGSRDYVGRSIASDGSCGGNSCVRTPQRVHAGTQPLTDAVALVAGTSVMCAEVRGGGLYCWGSNGSSQLGSAGGTFSVTAVQIPAGPFTGPAIGNSHSCALAWPSGAQCWGRNANGQLGNGLTSDSSTPVAMVLPSDAPSYPIETLTKVQRVERAIAAARAPFHLLGATLVSDGAGARVHLDQNFQLMTLGSHELQAGATLRHVPPRTLDARAPARGQGFLYRRFVVSSPSAEGWGANAFEWGSVPTLALARESVMQTAGADPSFYAGSSAALQMLDQSIGVRSTILRKRTDVRDAVSRVCTGEGVILVPDLPQPDLPSDTINGVCREVVAVQGGARTSYELSVVTSEDDTVETVAFGAQVSHASIKALQPASTVMASNNADLMATARATMASQVVADGRELRTAELMLMSPSSIFLEIPAAVREQGGFQLLFDGSLRERGPAADFTVLDGAISTRGGALNALASASVEVHPTDWSMPRYDAYGLPIDWVPSADPSLLGSNGEEPYLYFLRLAEKTAREATKAIEDAAETTRQEELDAQALAAAQQKGAQLREQENELLCGKAQCTELEWMHQPPVADIDAGCSRIKIPLLLPGVPSGQLALDSAITVCEIRVMALRAMLSEPLRMPAVVWQQRARQVPSFEGLEGTELGKNLLGSWTALRRLRDAYETALASIRTAEANVAAAKAEHVAALDEIDVQTLNQRLQELSLEQQKQALITQATELRGRLEAAQTAKERVCSEAGFKRAVKSGYSFSHAHNMEATYFEKSTKVEECAHEEIAGKCYFTETKNYEPGNWKYDFEYDDGARTWSPGALYAWDERCDELKEQLAAASKVANETTLDTLDQLAEDIGSVLGPGGYDLAAGAKAATSRALAAEERVDAAEAAANLSYRTSLGTVQEARAALLGATHEIELVHNKLKLATARYELDQSLSETEIALRHKLRRRYQGFSAWRAEAMAESARRTAVAARRAIESRFVVDLSRLGNEEPFVAPPAVWADDVYDRDLKPPAAVGVTLSEGGGPDQQYNNKLLDYVGNLELFVSGYSIERPTSSARSDAEVVTLPAPATIEAMDVGADTYPLVNADAMGWKFWCEGAGEYISNPAGVLFGELDESIIATMCDGQPPTRAVLTFAMDPWGRVSGNPFAEPFDARHNARWQRFALNLVGTGIRECENAADPDQCYAEPFIRYGLRHVGPAWVTSYDLAWHALEIPSAVVEDGKALAIEEWLDPVSRGWSVGEVQSVARTELAGRPLGGVYELSLELTPDVRLSRIERIQMLTSVDYWVRQD